MARRGDLIRCTVKFDEIFEQNDQEKVPVLFTLNGERIIILEDERDQSIVYTPSSLFPYIGLSDGCSVLAKVCECIFELPGIFPFTKNFEFPEISSDEWNSIFQNFRKRAPLREVYPNFRKFLTRSFCSI